MMIPTVTLMLATCMPSAMVWDEEALPASYTRVTDGSKYIFVMLVPRNQLGHHSFYRVYDDSNSQKFTETQGDLGKIYPNSGLYLHNGSTKPLWTIDWYSFDARPCSDGKHLVRWGPWARSGDMGQTLALAFYQSGKEIKSYRVLDLVADYKSLPRSVSHYEWDLSSSFDDSRKELKVQLQPSDYGAKPGKTLLFDISSGKFKTIAEK